MKIKILTDEIYQRIEECNDRISHYTFHRCFRLKDLECVKKQAYSEILRAIEKASNAKELEETLKNKSYLEHGDYKGLLEKGFVRLAEEKYVASSVYFEFIHNLHLISL
ncbi:MAG: hypothetical protein IJW64_00520 [Clostridia bacterium]|nr:hypothetical protein [Clostridia bacterium]